MTDNIHNIAPVADFTEFEKKIITDMCQELWRARQKFPGSEKMFMATTEEFGEYAQAVLHLDEKDDGTCSTRALLRDNAYQEGIQLMTCVMRLLSEGDKTLGYKGRCCSVAGCQRQHIGGPCPRCHRQEPTND